ncbi:MAG: DUF1987 domain-containing protein [Cytophagales bacterium]|nr:DUF1987 domain-containing protein [Cytophagales bacterium]MDW8384965.1 DUF1987 domain-containing protein [Flammeovirgaceae bacterium]
MEDLKITGQHGSFFTPNVHFSASTGICEISGESYLEESFEFYDRLIRWVEEYFQQNDRIIVNFKLTYFNTSSSRAILDLLKVLKKYKDEGKDVTVNWYYPDPDDDEMLMEAEDYIDETGLDINLISYTIEKK